MEVLLLSLSLALTLAIIPTPPPPFSFFDHILAVVDVVDLFKPYRVFHGSELPLVFDLWPALIGPGETDLGKFFASAWASFAATGDPNVAGAPAWPSFAAGGNVTLGISTSAQGVVVESLPSFLKDTCAFWAANPIDYSVIWGAERK